MSSATSVLLSDQKPSTSVDAISRPPSLLVRIVYLLVVTVPLLGVAAAVVLLWEWGFHGLHLGLLGAMWLVSGIGVTVGYHRLFTHRAFQTTRPIQAALAICGSMALEGPVLKWAAQHRLHHHHSDEEGDPHSPHLHGEGFWAMARGLWHAHMGWMFGTDTPGLSRYVKDLMESRMLRVLSDLSVLWAAAGLLIPAALGGLLTWSWSGVLLGFIWGGLVRIFLVHHLTFSINSVCHFWGGQPFRSHDHSRNNIIFGILGFGEGWHNNHHAFPTSARHGLFWWQVDLSYLVIRLMECVGLAWEVRQPGAEAMAAKRQ